MADFNDLDVYMSGPDVTKEDLKYIEDAVLNGWYGSNAYKYVELFESAFAKMHNRIFALMTTNCTSAIHLILQALNVQEGDEVLVPEITWIASAAPVVYQRAKPVFVDVNEENWCIDIDDLESKISPRTKAVIVVNVYGNMPDYDRIEKLCETYGITLIEDAAESLGSEFNNKKSGGFGTASVFSFHRTKTLTTGEGGMLLLNDQELFERCKFLRDHGRKPGSFFNTEVTTKYMPSNIAASLGFAQLQRVDELISKKQFILDYYRKNIKLQGFASVNPEPQNVRNGAWCTALVFDKSTNIEGLRLMDYMTQEGIPVRPFFFPLSQLPAFEKIKSRTKNINPIAKSLSSRGCCLPSALNLKTDDLQKISTIINRFISQQRS